MSGIGGTETHWLGHDVISQANASAGEVSRHHEGPVGTKLLAWAPGVDARDPIMLAGAGAVLIAVGLFAGWLPARAASRMDPTAALRS